jgi:PAS domain S-box-containing protein
VSVGEQMRGRGGNAGGAHSVELLGRIDAIIFEATATESTLRLASAAGGALARLGVSADACGADPQLLAAAIHPDDRPAMQEILRAVATDGGVRQLEHRMVAVPSGEERWFRTEVRALAPSSAADHAGARHLRGLMLDVTEARRTVEALRDSERRLQHVVSHAPIVLFVIDLDGTITFSDGSGLEKFGRQPGESVGMNVFELYRDEPAVCAYVRRALKGESYTSVAEMVKTGTVWETRWAPIFDGNGDGGGRVCGVTGVALDVTARHRAQDELASTVALLRSTLEAVSDGVLVVDNSGRVVACNRRFIDMWRIPDELASLRDDGHMLAYVVDQLRDPDAFLGKVRQLYAEPHASSHDIIEFKDGRIFERDSRPRRVDGKTIGRVWSFRDVTSERRASRRASFLAAASKVLAGPLDDGAPLDSLARLTVPYLGDWCAIFLVDAGGAIRCAAAHHRDASKLEILRQLQPDPLGRGVGIGRIIRDGVPLFINDLTPERVRAIGGASVFEHPLPHGQMQLVLELKTRAGLGVPLRVRGRTLGAIAVGSGDTRRHYDDEDVTVATDLAQRAALMLDNQGLYRASLDAVALRDEFLSVASHELRTPVTSLQLAVQSVLAVGEAAEPAFLRQALESAERQTRRLSRLMGALLDVSRVHGGWLELQRDEVDLVALVRDVTRALGEDARRAGCAIEMNSGLVSLTGRWDRSRLEQVVTNLVSNALKYGAGKPVALTVRRAGDARAQIEVRDQGIGVPESERERIFERFERAVSARHYGGLGLGLYIVRRIVTAHGGTVSVGDALGGGASFVVTLPLD